MPGYVIPTNGFESLSYKKCQCYQLKANNIIIIIFYDYSSVLTVVLLKSNVWIRSMYVIFFWNTYDMQFTNTTCESPCT